jgi:putative PIN family toxin of toxin-antitoxin system
MIAELVDPRALTAPIVVIDTNVVLDMLVFQDSRVQSLHQHLSAGQLLWIATTAMMEELADVLDRPLILRVCPDRAATMARAMSLCRLVPAPEMTIAAAPVCADPDDQIFIDLAWCWPAAWLLTRDRALLALATRAKTRQVHVLTPANWPGLNSLVSAPP